MKYFITLCTAIGMIVAIAGCERGFKSELGKYKYFDDMEGAPSSTTSETPPSTTTGDEVPPATTIYEDALKPSQIAADREGYTGQSVTVIGIATFGGGRWRGTPLAEMLPVKIPGAFDLQRAAPGAFPRPRGRHPAVHGTAFPAAARFYWIHDLAPRPDAVVLLEGDGRALAVAGTLGAGRTLVIPATCHGEAAPGETEAWRTEAWTRFLTRAARWLWKDATR